MSLEDIYDADCHLIKPPDIIDLEREEDDIIKSINKKHLYGVKKSEYPIEFLRKLDKLLNEDIIDFECDDSNYTMEIGFYFEKKDNYDYAKKYYLMAIEKGNEIAMYNLALYYEECEKDYDNMLKYYLMAIEKGDSDAMNNLGSYYKQQKDYDNMKKYYLMAIKQDNVWAMDRLGDYYNEQKDYDNMEKYYRMAIEKGSVKAKKKLDKYYEEIYNYDTDTSSEADLKIGTEKIKNLLKKLKILI